MKASTSRNKKTISLTSWAILGLIMYNLASSLMFTQLMIESHDTIDSIVQLNEKGMTAISISGKYISKKILVRNF
jgi:hypothetical protein